MTDFELPWGKIFIGSVSIVALIIWGRFMSGFRTKERRNHTLSTGLDDIRSQLGPRGFRIFYFLLALGLLAFVVLRLLQLRS